MSFNYQYETSKKLAKNPYSQSDFMANLVSTLVASLTKLDFTKDEKTFLFFLCSEAIISNLAKLETRLTVISPPMVSTIWVEREIHVYTVDLELDLILTCLMRNAKSI